MNARNDRLKVESFAKQVAKTHGRVAELYNTDDISSVSQSELVPIALKELGIATEELQVALEELSYQNEVLTLAYEANERKQQRCQTLFDLAPEVCLLTNSAGIIEEANRAAALLLKVQQRLLIGRPLASLVAPSDYSYFNSAVARLARQDQIELTIKIQPNHEEPRSIVAIVDVVRDSKGEVELLRWILRDAPSSNQLDFDHSRKGFSPEQNLYDFSKNRSQQSFCKGDVIPLTPQTLWLVTQGVAKLTTLSDVGEEMLVGLVASGMVFGSSLTSFQTYQAIALTEVRLVSVPVAEIMASPRLAQALLPKISQRLQQTEKFLLVCGQLKVEDRLQHLLTLLAQEIGESVVEGKRLQARLTHQDLASACSSTRVTITRLLGKLQQEGKIRLDSQNHLIINSRPEAEGVENREISR